MSSSPADFKKRLFFLWQERPLTIVLGIALLIRLLAAFFSKGYAFSDDHFCVIRPAQYWLYGFPFWLDMDHPPLHSMTYAGLHYLLFDGLTQLGITQATTKMLIARLLHALYSLLTVYFGYKITLQLTNKEVARKAGLLLALLWFMPFLSVKNLVEMVCIPICLAGFYGLLKAHQSGSRTSSLWFWAGVCFGIAFVLRLHTILFAGGVGLVMLYRRQWLGSLWFTLGYLLAAASIQGAIDAYFFDYPFHSLVSYFTYNANNAYNYVTGGPEKFFFTIIGFLVPPISLFLLYGFVRARKIAPMLFVAALVFFIFHSAFPNKQERFILPMLPLIVILGTIGWEQFIVKSAFWQKRDKLLKACWVFFWVLNLTAALGLSLTYSKKSRIAPLLYLSEKSDLQAVLIEGQKVPMPPVFYLDRLAAHYEVFRGDELGTLPVNPTKEQLSPNYPLVFTWGENKDIVAIEAEIQQTQQRPNYLVLIGQKDLQSRLAGISQLFPDQTITLETSIQPALYDRILHFLNPHVHQDEYVSIYRVE